MPNNASLILRRMMGALGARTQGEFAKKISITPPTVSSAIERDRIPDIWIYKVAYLTGHTPEWFRSSTQTEGFPPTTRLGKDSHAKDNQSRHSLPRGRSNLELKRPSEIAEREERLQMEFIEALQHNPEALHKRLTGLMAQRPDRAWLAECFIHLLQLWPQLDQSSRSIHIVARRLSQH